jgi:phosphate-selective porin OprO/OprP
MLNHIRQATFAIVALLALLVPAIAQAENHGESEISEEVAEHEAEHHEWVTKWSNGHKIEKGKTFKMKFGGRIQADYQFADPDDELEEALDTDIQSGFEFRRARLFFEGTVYDRVKFKAQYDFAGGDADFKDVYVGLLLNNADLIFGHVKEPFSLGELTSSKYIAFLERATPTEVFSPSRNSGISAFGAPSEKINWGVGFYYDADDFGVSIDEDRFNITGRVAFRPIYEDKGKRLIHVGLSGTSKSIEEGGTLRFRGRPGAHFGPRFVDTSGIPADDALAFALELAGVHGPFWWQAEYYNMDVSSPEVDVSLNPVDPTLDGYYIQGGYYLTGEHRRYKTSTGGFDRQKPKENWGNGGRGAWEIAFRYTTTDLSEAFVTENRGELDTYTLGVNWYLNPATRFMMNYVVAETPARGDANFLLFRWQVDF